jgi:hypothetical protein
LSSHQNDVKNYLSLKNTLSNVPPAPILGVPITAQTQNHKSMVPANRKHHSDLEELVRHGVYAIANDW